MKVFGRPSPTFHYRQHRRQPGDSMESRGRGTPEESLELALNLGRLSDDRARRISESTRWGTRYGAEISAF